MKMQDYETVHSSLKGLQITNKLCNETYNEWVIENF